MNLPVGPADVTIVQGASGKGLQVTCVCGAVNWNHLEMRTALLVICGAGVVRFR